jgi:hypothetical protein
MSQADDKISKLYHEADEAVPSKALDDTILSASREAVEKPANAGPFSASWPAAVSVAAIIVIAVILVPVLKQEESLQKTEQTSTQKSLSSEPADDHAFQFYSAGETRNRVMSPPSSLTEPSRTEAGTLAAKQATPGLGTAATDDTDAAVTRKLSRAAEMENPVADTTTNETHSRMEAADSAPFAVLTPEMWQVRINRMIEDGELEKAKAELNKLEAHFPNHRISPALSEKLRP